MFAHPGRPHLLCCVYSIWLKYVDFFWRRICQERLVSAAGLRAAEWTSIMLNCEGSSRSSAAEGRWLVSGDGVVHHDTRFNASANLTWLPCAAAFHTSLQMDRGGGLTACERLWPYRLSLCTEGKGIRNSGKEEKELMWNSHCKAAIRSNVHLLLVSLPTVRAANVNR